MPETGISMRRRLLTDGASMEPSVRSRAISGVLRLGVRPILHRIPGHPGGIRTARSTVDAASLLMRPGSRVRVLPLHDPQLGTGRDERPVAGEWVVSRDDGSAASAGTAGGAVLYLHGGGYVVCSPRTHRPITSRLALDTGLPVLVPRYRLAPEHPFPAPLEDAVAAYRWRLARGVPAARIVLAGDSGRAPRRVPGGRELRARAAAPGRDRAVLAVGGPDLRTLPPRAAPRTRPVHQRRVGAAGRPPRGGAGRIRRPAAGPAHLRVGGRPARPHPGRRRRGAASRGRGPGGRPEGGGGGLRAPGLEGADARLPDPQPRPAGGRRRDARRGTLRPRRHGPRHGGTPRSRLTAPRP